LFRLHFDKKEKQSSLKMRPKNKIQKKDLIKNKELHPICKISIKMYQFHLFLTLFVFFCENLKKKKIKRNVKNLFERIDSKKPI